MVDEYPIQVTDPCSRDMANTWAAGLNKSGIKTEIVPVKSGDKKCYICFRALTEKEKGEIARGEYSVVNNSLVKRKLYTMVEKHVKIKYVCPMCGIEREKSKLLKSGDKENPGEVIKEYCGNCKHSHVLKQASLD